MLGQFWTHPYKITAGEVPGAYFIKLLFGSGMEPASFDKRV